MADHRRARFHTGVMEIAGLEPPSCPECGGDMELIVRCQDTEMHAEFACIMDVAHEPIVMEVPTVESRPEPEDPRTVRDGEW